MVLNLPTGGNLWKPRLLLQRQKLKQKKSKERGNKVGKMWVPYSYNVKDHCHAEAGIVSGRRILREDSARANLIKKRMNKQSAVLEDPKSWSTLRY